MAPATAEESTCAAWQAKGVIPITYWSAYRHKYLRDTLVEWAAQNGQGLTGKIARAVELAPRRGVRSGDDEAEQLIWALREVTGRAAEAFAATSPSAPIDWLPVLEKAGLLGLSISTSPESEHMMASLASQDPRGVTYRYLHPATRHLGGWLTQHLDQIATLRYVCGQGRCPHPGLRRLIRRAIAANDTLPIEIKRLWQIVSSDSFSDRSLARRDAGLSYVRPDFDHWDALQRRRLLRALRPVPLVVPRSEEWFDYFGQDHAPEADDPWSLADLSIGLVTPGRARQLYDDLTGHANAESLLAGLAFEFTALLQEALDWCSVFGRATRLDDPSHFDFPSISSHPQNRRRKEWTVLIELARDSFVALRKTDETCAMAVVRRWRKIDYLTFHRLTLFAATT